MKSNKGITLISLMVYIVVLTLVVAMVTVFTKYFYANTEEAVLSNKTSEQYTLLLSYITNDINSGKISAAEVTDSGKIINFYFEDETVHQYAFDEDNGKVYYILYDSSSVKQKQIALCEEIDDGGCTFTYASSKLTIKITINSTTYSNTFSV